MSNLIAIKLKALLMLTVFTANFYAVCHCKDIAIPHHTLSKRMHKGCGENCCHEERGTTKNGADHHKPCNEKDGCCGSHAVKFSLLEKQTAQQVALNPVFAAALTHHFIIPIDIFPLSCNTEGRIEQEWIHKHSPPDLQSLYQRFLI